MSIKNLTIQFIKVISTVLITSAVLLEAWHLISGTLLLSAHLMPIVWIGRFAVAAHFIEGILAAAIAPSKGESSFKYAIYTFFVGTVGLFELIDDDQLPGFLNILRS